MKNRFYSVLRGSFGVFILTLFCLGCQSKNPPEWKQLFNGRDLSNWQVKLRGHELNENFGKTFRVEDGHIQVRYDEYENGFQEKYGHLFYNDTFSSYLLGVEYRFIGDQVENNPGSWAYRNNGLMLHGQDPSTMGIDQDFPSSIEVQLLGGNGTDSRSTANICTPGTKFVMDGKLIEDHCTNSDSKTYHGDQWVRVEVLVLKDSLIAHYVNWEEVMRYEKPQTEEGDLLKEGSISIQSESHPTDFRKIEIINLEDYEEDPAQLRKVVENLLAEKRVAKQTVGN